MASPKSHQVKPQTRRYSSDAKKTFIAETMGTSNKDTRQKFENILVLTGPEELNDDYVNVYSTCALVGALIMSFLAPAAVERINPEGVDNVWGPQLTPWIVELNQVLVIVAFFISFLMVFLACVMLTQLAHIPKSETRLLFQNLGDAKVHAPLAHMQKLLVLYGVHFLISTSLNYHMYTAIVGLLVTIFAVVFGVYSASSIIIIKSRTLEVIRENMN